MVRQGFVWFVFTLSSRKKGASSLAGRSRGRNLQKFNTPRIKGQRNQLYANALKRAGEVKADLYLRGVIIGNGIDFFTVSVADNLRKNLYGQALRLPRYSWLLSVLFIINFNTCIALSYPQRLYPKVCGDLIFLSLIARE